jgi:Tol biopolymer transport system component
MAGWYRLGILSLLIIAVAAIWKIWPSKTIRYRPIPLTSDQGWETHPSFSPDARQIAYVWNPPGGKPWIFIKSIGADSAARLTAGTQPEFSPAWSPDGRFIAFVRSLRPKDSVALMLVPASGGPESQISELTTPSNISWSADGQWLIATDGPARMRSIVAISVATGSKHVLTGPFEFGYSGAGLSPDLRRLVFSRAGPGASIVYELALGPGLTPQGAPRAITSNFWAGEIVVTPDAKAIIYTDGSLEEGVGLWRLGLNRGAQPELIHGASDTYFAPAISRDGRRLAFAVSRINRADTWKKSLTDPEAPPEPLLSSTHSDLNPQYSPDGRAIAFHSTRTGASDIWVAASDGTNARRLTFTNARMTATPRWSPDGAWIAFESNVAGQSEIYIVRNVGGPIRRLTDNPATDAIPSWSRDGRTLYFCSDRTGRYEIWKIPVSGGEPTQVTFGGGFAAVESADGTHLYYSQTRNYGPVFRIPVAGGEKQEVIPEIRGLFYAVTPRGIYYQSNRAICFWDVSSGRTHEVFTPPKQMGIGLAVSPDGTALLFTQIERRESDLYMIDGLR